jgi:hypothetical protein
MASLYDAIKSKSAQDSSTTNTHRVEVNQRALIDKILARYASAGAVYRELLQNSNDAEASQAEVLFTVDPNNTVTQVTYKNNGMPFRTQDWDRLQKIAEGNPDEKKGEKRVANSTTEIVLYRNLLIFSPMYIQSERLVWEPTPCFPFVKNQW